MILEDLQDQLINEQENPNVSLPGATPDYGAEQPIYAQDTDLTPLNRNLDPILQPMYETYGYQGEIPQMMPWPQNGTGPQLVNRNGPIFPNPDVMQTLNSAQWPRNYNEPTVDWTNQDFQDPNMRQFYDPRMARRDEPLGQAEADPHTALDLPIGPQEFYQMGKMALRPFMDAGLDSALTGLASMGGLPMGIIKYKKGITIPTNSDYNPALKILADLPETFHISYVPSKVTEDLVAKSRQIPGQEWIYGPQRPGIGGGFWSPDDFNNLMTWMENRLKRMGIEVTDRNAEDPVGTLIVTRGGTGYRGDIDPRTVPHEFSHAMAERLLGTEPAGGPSEVREFQQQDLLKRLFEPQLGEYYDRVPPEELQRQLDQKIRSLPKLLPDDLRDKIMGPLENSYQQQIEMFGDKEGRLGNELLAFGTEPLTKDEGFMKLLDNNTEDAKRAYAAIQSDALIKPFMTLRDMMIRPEHYDQIPGPVIYQAKKQGPQQLTSIPVEDFEPSRPKGFGGPFPEPWEPVIPDVPRPDVNDVWNKTVRAFGWVPAEMTAWRRRQVQGAMSEILRDPDNFQNIIDSWKANLYK